MASYDVASTICQAQVSYMASYDVASTTCQALVSYMASYDVRRAISARPQ